MTKGRSYAALPRSVAEIVCTDIRERILSGELQPGTPLLLKEQSERLGVSIMPVREAIKMLHEEGLVIQQPQRGATVAPVSIEDMEDVYRTRIALECLAVKEVAKKITEADYKELNLILDLFEKEYSNGNAAKGREYHRQFHIQLYRIARSKTLNRLIPPLIYTSERYQSLSIYNRGTIKATRDEHQEILDACINGEIESASELMKIHLEKTPLVVKKELLED